MPPRIDSAATCASPCPKACGMISRNAAPSSVPIANETSIGIQLARRYSENAASAADSVPPAKLAARIQPSVMGLGILREPDQRGHSGRRAVPAVRVEADRVRVGAEVAAVDAFHAGAL